MCLCLICTVQIKQYSQTINSDNNKYALEEIEKKQQEKIDELELKLKGKQTLLQLSKSTLNKAKDTSLLDAIQNGLKQSLIASEEESEELGSTVSIQFDVEKSKIGADDVLQVFQIDQ